MNLSPKNYSAPARSVLPAFLIFLLAGNALAQKAADSPAASRPAKTPVISAEKTSFNEVTTQLDPGGSVYAYLSTSQWLEGLSGRVNGWREAVLSLSNLGEEGRSNLAKAVDIITRLIKNSGIEAIDGVGISGIALEKDFYQTKFVVHRDKSSAPGGMWTVFGRTPRPLEEVEWLPAETVLAGFSDVDVAAVWSALVKEVEQSGFPAAKEGLNRITGAVQAATGMKIDELIGSLGGRYGAFLTLNNANKIKIPLPQERTLEISEPGLVLVLKVKDDTLFSWIDRALQENPQVIRSDEGGWRMRMLPVPLPVPVTLRLTIARQGEYLFVASNDGLLKDMIAVKAGKVPGLKSTAEFKRLAKGMPLDGNSFSFVGQRLGDTVRQVQSSMLSQAGQVNDAKATLLQKMFSANQPVSSFVVGRSTPEGWFTVGHGTQQPANAVLLPFVVAPTAIIASITLPALAQAKGKAQSIMCINNLKQMGLAARIYATDHNDKFPPDVISMKNELTTLRILICPSDQVNAQREPMSWDNFEASRISYEYVSPGLSDSTPGIEKKVLFRCRIHGFVCMGDGSAVMQNSFRGN